MFVELVHIVDNAHHDGGVSPFFLAHMDHGVYPQIIPVPVLGAVFRLKQPLPHGDVVVQAMDKGGIVIGMDPVEPEAHLVGEFILPEKSQLFAEGLGKPHHIFRGVQLILPESDVKRALGGHLVNGGIAGQQAVQSLLALVLVVGVHKNADKLDGLAGLVSLYVSRRPIPAVTPVLGPEPVLQIILGSAGGIGQRLHKQTQGTLLVLGMEQVGPGFQGIGEIVDVVVADHVPEIIRPVGGHHLIPRADVHIPKAGGDGLVDQMDIVAFPENTPEI